MEQIKVSIIIPVYNTGLYLDKCLISIIRQTLKEIEIICVNDCSTDNSLEILKYYAELDTRIKIIDLPQNVGISAVRNSGLLAASGEYIGFVDSDDYISPGYFEILWKTAQKENCEVSCCNQFIYIFPKQLEFSSSVLAPGIYEVNSRLLELNSIAVMVWTKIFKKSLIDKVQLEFPVGLIHEDVYWHYCIMPYVSKLTVITDVKCLYFYRQHINSLMAREKEEKGDSFDIWLVIFDKIFQFYKAQGLLEKFSLPFQLICFYKQEQQLNKIRDLVSGYLPDIKKTDHRAMGFLNQLGL
ncbi:MAG: glycosyltransferase [Deltaproteobacteria bacterium]|jgi:glycosyltransferase involved in cell wall biosynthesis|nr:glycosyltransferase [Deltaproteobacteria bacterium]